MLGLVGSSLFLPGNLESYRLHSSPSNLGQLDYRCHTTDHSGNLTLPAKLSQCLTTLSTTSVDAIQVNHSPRTLRRPGLPRLPQSSIHKQKNGAARAV
jgi:hypothetical protein